MKLFLSFSFADREWVDEFADSLRDAGFDVLRWDTGIFSPGERVEDAFRRSLESADILVPILTERSVRNPNVMFELGFAKGTGKDVLSVLVTDRDGRPEFPSALHGQQYVRAETPKEAATQFAKYAKRHKTGA